MESNIIKKMQSLLCAINAVTAYHRHGSKIPKRNLDFLSNKQIEVEEYLDEKEMEEMWIVQQNVDGLNENFEFQGLFSSEEKAVAACKNENCYIFPATVDEELPMESMEEHPRAYYPLVEDRNHNVINPNYEGYLRNV